MAQINRKALEKPVSLRHAQRIVYTFCNDEATYPDRDVHSKSGICKVLSEEYCPLVRLAEECWCVRSVSLLPEANPGPDGEIRFWGRRSFKIQITCANEGYQRALMREQYRFGHMVLPRQARCRDRSSGSVESNGRILAAPAEDLRARVERIRQAILAKDKKYYPGTDTLLVQDDPANFKHLKEGGLHRRVCEAVQKDLGSQYMRIYVSYGIELKRIK